jgi:DNA polymerase III epsilon subunit-like protein
MTEPVRTLMILDTETSSLDPSSGQLLEVAVAVWSVEHASLVFARSWLIYADDNPAVAVNGIAPELLRRGVGLEGVMTDVGEIFDTNACDAIVAHYADFDRKWFTPEIQALPWACSCNDMAWPRLSSSRGLTSIALAHGVGVVAAHRALDDVMTLARLFERGVELGADVGEMVAQALRPKVRVVALTSFEERQIVKAHRFSWDASAKVWWRNMAEEDVAALPFKNTIERAGAEPSAP